MSQDVNGLISWLRSWFDDIYALKGSSSGITLNDVYPIGAIYMSVNSTNPSILFGGTWEQIEGRFLLATGDYTETVNGQSITVNYQTGAESGEMYHTLTTDEMPSHNHGNYSRRGNITYNSSGNTHVMCHSSNTNATSTPSGSGFIMDTGSSNAHNNMPPFIAVNVWKRTA